MKVLFGSDHAGYDLKQMLMAEAKELGHEVQDLGSFSAAESVDYPDVAEAVVQKMSQDKDEDVYGCLICGTGIGMSIAANRHDFIRAAVCNGSVDSARLARAHNNANVICFGARLTQPGDAIDCLCIFLSTSFEGGRHERRVQKLTKNK